MDTDSDPPSDNRSPHFLTWFVVALAAGTAIGAVLWFALHGPTVKTTRYPVGSVDASVPSGMALPTSGLTGYTLKYTQDFTGRSIPSGWYAFTGVPGGDPGGQFGASHVVVSHNLLQLKAYQDPAYNDDWVTGGICQCGLSYKYGAFFVRSRDIGAGPNQAELLWPKSNIWPPEIDFNENGGGLTQTSSTVHWGADNNIDQRHLSINMTKWHTWGVVWTPTSIIYVVDGRAWARIISPFEVPDVPMTLDLEQRTMCSEGRECPSVSSTMQVAWVAEYSPN
jgi:hypothetical protein